MTSSDYHYQDGNCLFISPDGQDFGLGVTRVDDGIHVGLADEEGDGAFVVLTNDQAATAGRELLRLSVGPVYESPEELAAEIERLREESARAYSQGVEDMREAAAHAVRQRDYAGHGEDNATVIRDVTLSAYRNPATWETNPDGSKQLASEPNVVRVKPTTRPSKLLHLVRTNKAQVSLLKARCESLENLHSELTDLVESQSRDIEALTGKVRVLEDRADNTDRRATAASERMDDFGRQLSTCVRDPEKESLELSIGSVMDRVHRLEDRLSPPERRVAEHRYDATTDA